MNMIEVVAAAIIIALLLAGVFTTVLSPPPDKVYCERIGGAYVMQPYSNSLCMVNDTVYEVIWVNHEQKLMKHGEVM